MNNQNQKIQVADELVSEGHLKGCETDIADRLQEVGFSNASKIVRSKPYPEIYEDRIFKFLERKAEAEIKKIQNRGYKYRRSIDHVVMELAALLEVIVETNDYLGSMYWKEEYIEKYNHLPPDFVIEKLKVAKQTGCFDYYTVATINFNYTKKIIKLADPLLFGRMRDNKTRYFIAQWDNDLHLDDL